MDKKELENIEVLSTAFYKAAQDSNIQVESEILVDLAKSMMGTFKTLRPAIIDIQSMIMEKEKNDLLPISSAKLKEIRDFSGSLSLLCNMILSGKEYSEKNE